MSPVSGNQRTWTDQQLRDAIASERSWRGVARALGMKSSSTNVIRRHARRLALDTSHFTGKRKWTDRDLQTAIGASSSWAEVLRRLDVSDTSEARARVKGHAVRHGFDARHLNGPRSERPTLDGILGATSIPAKLRDAAPSIAAAWFALRGCPVSVPIEPTTYDLLVDLSGTIVRVQVKSTTCRTPRGDWHVGIGHRPYAMDKSAGKAPYDPDLLDMYVVISGDGAIYLIPGEVVAGRVAVYLDSVPEYRVGDASSLLS